MALTLPTPSLEELSLSSYLELVAAKVDVTDEDSVLASAPWLAALARNRRFLAEEITRQLGDWQSFQPGNPYQSESLMLGGGRGYSVRINVWQPASPVAHEQQLRRSLGSYGVLHDHDFSFLTAGYFGPGYETLIYECDPERIEGRLGEQVDLRFLERTTLPEGKVMFYQARRDVHAQGMPESLSISLNLLVSSPGAKLVSQYYFDEEHRICELAGRESQARRTLCELARILGDQACAAPLEALAARHPSPALRLEAYRSLVALEPASASVCERLALADPHPLVRAGAPELAAPLRS